MVHKKLHRKLKKLNPTKNCVNQGIERQNRTCNICDKNEIGDEFHYVLQCPSLHDDRQRLLDSTYLTRVNVLKFANLFQSRNKIKLRHLCKFIKIFFFKNTSSWLVTSLSFFVVFLLCYIHRLVMCVQILILNVCIYLYTIVMDWFMRIKNLGGLEQGEN
jgi:hypothetical protein